MGTPKPQKVTLLLDTGSSDTWVNTPLTDYCQNPKSICNNYGTFDPTKSRTFRYGTPGGLKVSYVDRTFATGNYGTDIVSIGPRPLTDFQFGLATTTNIAHGTLGLGPRADEEEIIQKTGNGYPTFTQALFNQKFIKTKAYSLWFNDLQAATGSIVFGGVDTAKFIPNLATFSSPRGEPSTLRVEEASLGATKSSTFDVTLDSGSQNTILPPDFVQSVWNAVHAVQGAAGEPYVDCGLAALQTTMDFNFGSTTIHVPMSQLVYKNPEGQPPPSPTASVSYCSFGIVAVQKPEDVPVLGDTFLRSAYVVYDLSRKEISIAQALITPKSTIVELDEAGVGKLYGSGVDNSQRPISPATVGSEQTKPTTYDNNALTNPIKEADRTPETEDRSSYENNRDDDNNNNNNNEYYEANNNNDDQDSNTKDNPANTIDPNNPYNSHHRHQSTPSRTAPNNQENLFAELLAKLGDKFSFLKPFIT